MSAEFPAGPVTTAGQAAAGQAAASETAAAQDAAGQTAASAAPGEWWRDGVRSRVLWNVLRAVTAAREEQTGRRGLDIVDVGGGTGGLAVPFAALGHHVTVVDPSPDALAAAQRRAAEVKIGLSAVQGEADELDGLIGQEAADLIICHSVLEYVESPGAAMASIARVLRPGGTVSLLAAGAAAAVLHRALAGRYAEARELLAAIGPDGGAAGAAPRRFTLDGLVALIEAAGMRAGDAHGIRVFSGLVPGGGGDTDALRALEDAAAVYPALRDIAARLHVLGHR